MRRYVCWNIQLACERILSQNELDQIDEVAELLGHLSCQKVEMLANVTAHV